jgi:diguanylate cyclase (GGDEF)-like protein/PAS domain S-box-containing protein
MSAIHNLISTILATSETEAFLGASIAFILFCGFEWRDRLRRTSLADANRRLAVNARFVEMSNDLALTLDYDRQVIACNRAWEDQLGWTLEDLRQKPVRDRFHPDDVDRVVEGFAKLAAGDSIDGIPVRMESKSGKWHWLEWSAVGSPEEKLIYASARDVSSRVQLEHSLEIERLQLRSAQEIARIGSWHVEVETGEMFWSEATFELLAIIPPDSGPDMNLWLSCLDPAEHERAMHRLIEALKNGGEFGFEFKRAHPGPNGEPVYLVAKGIAEQGPDGKVTELIGTIVDVTERKRYEEGLRFIADHDPLTGLANRRKFDEVLGRHLAECERYGPRGAAFMVDLDKLKIVNDELGHVSGDDMLRCVADALRDRLRDTDFGARLGGDEFAVLLTETTREGAVLVAESLAERLAESSPALRAVGVDTVTASIGVVMIEDLGELTANQLIAASDDAMYRAKRSGPGNIRVHHAFIADTRHVAAA